MRLDMPRGAPPKVDHVRDDFIYQIDSAQALVLAVKPLEAIHPNAPRSLHSKHVRRVEELAFLGVCGAWEEFLERSMVRYMAGAKTSSGFAPTLSLGKCQNIPHAYQVVSGDPDHDPLKHFLTWTNPPAVVKLGRIFFKQGEPFTCAITKRFAPLKLAVRIRNRVAHASEKCKDDFKSAALSLLGRASTDKLGQGYRVGDLLNEPVPAAIFGSTTASSSATVFQAYMQMYRELAKAIVPT
jgi:hypothetical protein